MAAPARMVPANAESVIVTACDTHQYTFLQGGGAPIALTTERPVPVRAPVPSVPILKIQIPSAGPSRVHTPPEVSAASKQ